MARTLSLRELRKQAHLSQAALGRALGVADSSISSWERGESVVPHARLSQLAQALGVSLEEVTASARSLAAARVTGDQQMRHDVRELLVREASISDEELAIVLEVLDRLAALNLTRNHHSGDRAAVVCGHAGYVARHLRPPAALPHYLQNPIYVKPKEDKEINNERG
ncbi:transcriptional repressor DicA [Mycobacteroides abscessus subsp. abscessus]|uniref:helix-turn-helix transcriptional regulator n=1 Tax=Mycobacteroides abscessus TaxID=36809 RepID=UPI0009A5B8AA|nr:transcriptional repressor DicA [Mycobacteroides abscessus subsp. abscessus]